MTSDADLVARRIRDQFAGEDVARVEQRLTALELPSAIPADRVRLAILKLAGGDTARFDMLARLAETDPRDVVGEAEYPRQMRHAPGMATEQMILADREEYESWLNGPQEDGA